MSGISIVKLLGGLSESKDQEAMAPWLVALDRNQDGSLQKKEVRDGKGRLRCDPTTARLGTSRWQSLESLLLDSGLIKKNRREACELVKTAGTPEPIVPLRRRPAEYLALFFAKTFDWVFALNPKISLKKLLRFLKTRVDHIDRGKESITVALNSGQKVKLELNSQGGLSKIQYEDPQGNYSLVGRLQFLQIFRDASVFEKYFSKNPYYKEEKKAWLHLDSTVLTAREIPEVSLKDVRSQGWEGVLLFPDHHGRNKPWARLYRLLKKEDLGWLALEMLPHTLQPALDDFISEPEDSDKFKRAKRKIQDSFSAFWGSYFPKVKDPDQLPYYRLLLRCKERGIRVVALDCKMSYFAVNQKIAPLSIATRNLIWVEHLPKEGKGIVFGGFAHFTQNKKARVQDFLLEAQTSRKVQLLSLE